MGFRAQINIREVSGAPTCMCSIFSNATLNGCVKVARDWRRDWAEGLSPFACIVSISLLRLSTASSTFHNTNSSEQWYEKIKKIVECIENYLCKVN